MRELSEAAGMHLYKTSPQAWAFYVCMKYADSPGLRAKVKEIIPEKTTATIKEAYKNDAL